MTPVRQLGTPGAGRYRALATDYDGTIAQEGRVEARTVSALARLRAAGWRLVLVTGRELEDLQHAFPRLDVFDRAVVENGGVVYRPADREAVALAAPPPEPLVARLRERGVRPLGVGRVVVATSDANASVLREEIEALGLHHRLILNKGAVMALPAGVDKGSGLVAALSELGLAPADAVGVGDAENDVAFLSICGRSAAVADALPALTEHVDLVLGEPGPAGVRELVAGLLHP